MSEKNTTRNTDKALFDLERAVALSVFVMNAGRDMVAGEDGNASETLKTGYDECVSFASERLQKAFAAIKGGKDA